MADGLTYNAGNAAEHPATATARPARHRIHLRGSPRVGEHRREAAHPPGPLPNPSKTLPRHNPKNLPQQSSRREERMSKWNDLKKSLPWPKKELTTEIEGKTMPHRRRRGRRRRNHFLRSLRKRQRVYHLDRNPNRRRWMSLWKMAARATRRVSRRLSKWLHLRLAFLAVSKLVSRPGSGHRAT